MGSEGYMGMGGGEEGSGLVVVLVGFKTPRLKCLSFQRNNKAPVLFTRKDVRAPLTFLIILIAASEGAAMTTLLGLMPP